MHELLKLFTKCTPMPLCATPRLLDGRKGDDVVCVVDGPFRVFVRRVYKAALIDAIMKTGPAGRLLVANRSPAAFLRSCTETTISLQHFVAAVDEVERTTEGRVLVIFHQFGQNFAADVYDEALAAFDGATRVRVDCANSGLIENAAGLAVPGGLDKNILPAFVGAETETRGEIGWHNRPGAMPRDIAARAGAIDRPID